jgi:drug/metabolite transporter (DMT)-like permease
MTPSRLILLLLMNAAWGASYSAYKVIGPALSTGGIVTLRFGMAAVCLFLFWPWLPGHAPRGRDLIKTCLMGVLLSVLGQRLQVYGNELGTAGNSSVLMAVEPLITSLAAALFLHEPIGPRRWAGFVLGMAGVALISGIGRQDFQWVGLTASLIFVSSFVCEAAYSIIGKPVVLRAGAMKMLAISLGVGTALNLLVDGPATLSSAVVLPAAAWALLLFLAVICTAVGYTIWFVVIRECPVNLAALTIFAQPVFGLALATVWLREELHLGQLLGSLVIIAGLLLGLSRHVRRGKSAATTSPSSGYDAGVGSVSPD